MGDGIFFFFSRLKLQGVCWNVPWMVLYKMCCFFVDWISKMAATAVHCFT